MKTKIPYLIMTMLICKLAWSHFQYKKQLEDVGTRDETAIALSKSYEDENRLVYQKLPNESLIGPKNQEIQLLELLDHEYQIVVISSIVACSGCRDNELMLWNQMKEQNPELPVTLIVTEDVDIDHKQKEAIKSVIAGIGVEFPYYLDRHSTILKKLGLSTKTTPISLLVDASGSIVAANRGTWLTYEKSNRFSQMASALMAP